MSTKDPAQQQRKRRLFSQIDSFVPANIAEALRELHGDRSLFHAARARYYPLMRLVDPSLGRGFKLLHEVGEALTRGDSPEFLQGFVAHYAELGETEIVLKTIADHPVCIQKITNIALLNCVANTTLPEQTYVWDISLPDHPTAFSIPPQPQFLAPLDRLKVSNQAQFQAFVPHFQGMPMLMAMSATGCQLETLPEETGYLCELAELNLAQNRMEELPKVMRELIGLHVLDLSDNLLQALPIWLDELQELHTLLFQGNKLKQIPACLLELPAIKILRLDSNKLTALPMPSAPANLGLQSLNLARNPLLHFPPAILQLKDLQVLHLDACGLSELPSEIANLQQLEQLHLSQNPITSLPAEIGQLLNLQSLDLSGTMIQDLPKSIASLKLLKQLVLNRKSIVPASAEAVRLQDMLPHCSLKFV